MNFVFLLAQPPMSPVLRALASPKGLKGKNPRLQHQSEQFWVAQKPTKGGGGLRPPPPFVGFFAPKILRTAAEGLGFFPFNPLGLARALKTGLIGGARARRNTKFNFSSESVNISFMV